MERSAARAGSRTANSNHRRVLVVDDHEFNLKLLARLLELEGHEVRAANSLAAAERALAEEQPAMIVLDLNLPDGSGLELTRKLKSHPLTASIPIVACTAAVLQADEDQALEAGCDAFVAKPIDTRRFSTIVSSMLS
jgi:CheY-like chemotaxis protein